MKHRYTLVALLMTALAGSSLHATDRLIPTGYYTPIDGKTTSELKTALYQVINPHTEVSSYSNLPQYFMRTDLYPESTRWWDMYSDIPLYAPSFKGLNREHSFPKSWWGGSQDTPAYTDLNHLYPSEAAANQAKSNYPLGVVDKTRATKFDNGITVVGVPVSGQGGGAQQVFEPDDEYKGDFARTYFYVVTCYQNLTWKYQYMATNGTYPTLNSWSQELLLKWSREDPVSQKEIDRNEQVYAIQNNRNPFIDFPDLCEYIWGNKKGDAFILSEHMDNSGSEDKTPILITPTQGMELEFGEVAIGHTGTAKLHLNGQNLTAGQNLTLTIYDNSTTNGAKYFNMDGSSRTTVSAGAVNSADGVWVTITYHPTDLGEHTTRLVISGAGISGSVGIGLRGESLEEPVLTAPVALAATDVTATSYTANWEEAPAGETVDYWVVNRTRYGANAGTEQLVAEENHLEITEFDGSESYTVQSVRLGILSPESNSIQVTNSGIQGIEAGTLMSVRNFPGGILITCPETVYDFIVCDTAGKMLMRIDAVEDNQVIDLPAGVYIVNARGLATPAKVIVRTE